MRRHLHLQKGHVAILAQVVKRLFVSYCCAVSTGQAQVRAGTEAQLNGVDFEKLLSNEAVKKAVGAAVTSVGAQSAFNISSCTSGDWPV